MSSPSRHPRAKSPLRAKPQASTASPVFNETKLVRAIQALDSTWKLQSKAEIDYGHSASALSDLFREALCTLLELASCFDNPNLVTKSPLKIMSSARILGCLKRFVAGCAGRDPPLGACCEQKCEQRLVHLTLLNILFRMCREPEIASNVVKEDLHSFLIGMCRATPSQQCDLDAWRNSKAEAETTAQDEVAFDPQDLMLPIDPFDWCYQPLCAHLLEEKMDAYFIPIGSRTLICLLRGVAVPTDEVSELEQQIHASSGNRVKTLKHRKLPSIFAFPVDEDGDEHGKKTPTMSKIAQYKLPPLWCEKGLTEDDPRDALWSLVRSDSSRIHLALRCLIALGIHLPRASLEHRSFLREGDNIRRAIRTYTHLSLAYPSNFKNAINSWGRDSKRVDLLPFQRIAIEGFTLKRIISSALSVFTEEQITIAIPKQHITIGKVRTLTPIGTKSERIERTKKRRALQPQSIQQRLNAASEAAHSEIIRWESRQTFQNQNSELARHRQRLAIRKLCADAEKLRDHLVCSLEILCSGRQHADPQQPFSDWIKSLPTLETLERERQYQQEIRHREILTQQYEREAQRRRERDGCRLMQANDYNVRDESEVWIRQQKQEHFRRMQAAIRQLLQHNVEDNEKSKTLALQERQRVLQLENERREGRELEKMCREDFYYVERILRAKAKAKDEQEKRETRGDLEKQAIDEHKKHIERRRLQDEEKRLNERESSGLRLEDLFGRQMRYRDVEITKKELQNEWRERKEMLVEEHECRSRWTLWERALMQRQERELKQQPAEARRFKWQQQREDREIRAAWVENCDDNGNKYYYNSLTGVSQWEAPNR